MNLKIYNKTTKLWEIVGSSNASNIEVVNPGFVNESGGTVSLNNALTKLDNRLTKAEQNIIWLAHNKGEGGSGGGSGSSLTYTIELIGGNTIYTSTGKVDINFTISSGSLKKQFTVVVKNLTTGKTLTTVKKYSMTSTSISLTGLTSSANLEIYAYDTSENYCSPVYVYIIAGALSVSLSNKPAQNLYVTSSGTNFTYDVKNSTGSAATFTLYINNEVYDVIENSSSQFQPIYNTVSDILKDKEISSLIGKSFTVYAVVSANLNGEELSSKSESFTVTVVDAGLLMIITSNISTNPEEPTECQLGYLLMFNYFLSYGKSYKTFVVSYRVFNQEGVEVISPVELDNITKGETLQISLSTVQFDPMNDGEYLTLEISAYARDAKDDTSAQDTRYVYFKITEAQKTDLYAWNDASLPLIAYFSKVTGFPNNTTGDWNYKPSSRFPYSQNAHLKKLLADGVTIKAFKCNGTTTGYISNTDGNQTPALRLSGESYAMIPEFSDLFSEYDIASALSIFTSAGFTLSFTFKADETIDSTDTILSLGKYDSYGNLSSGLEITSQKVLCNVGSAASLTCKLPVNEIVTVDLDVSKYTTYWYFKIYLNGTLTQVRRVTDDDINGNWNFSQPLYLACRNNNGTLSRFSSVYFYDIKIFTKSQNEYSITRNYISATCQANLKDGLVDEDLDSSLRVKNFIKDDGSCLLCGSADGVDGVGDYLEGSALYNQLIGNMNADYAKTPYPVVLIQETRSSSDFYNYSIRLHSEQDKQKIIATKFPCTITYTNELGSVKISKPDTGVTDDNGVCVSLLGTSTLTYKAKNFEIYMGDKDSYGNEQLFTPKDEWLPENEFTLKADVMDSAHVNNVAIGSILNGGTGSSIFGDTPPMGLPSDLWDGDENADKIRNKIKHTSEGFTVLLFIKFADEQSVSDVKFMGIYNFNLGRKAYYNLGLKLLKSYEKPAEIPEAQQAYVVTDYEVINDYWGKSNPKGHTAGNYSMEISENDSTFGSFLQDDMSIVKAFTSAEYYSSDEASAYSEVLKLYTQLAGMVTERTQKYTMSSSGNSFVEKPDEYYAPDSKVYSYETFTGVVNLRQACTYFVCAMIFGLVDSLGKNLTLRMWGDLIWYMCFYDMDSALELDNQGDDSVAYYAFIHWFMNTYNEGDGLSENTVIKNFASGNGRILDFSCYNSRLWNVLSDIMYLDRSGYLNYAASDGVYIEAIYNQIRKNIIKDPKEFIEKYYLSYTDKIGSMVFNYDYKIKYLEQAKMYDSVTNSWIDSTSFELLKFLHGNRVVSVKDWFEKRIKFLDGVFGVYEKWDPTADNGKGAYVKDAYLDSTITSPLTSLWANNKAGSSNTFSNIEANITGSSKILMKYSTQNKEQYFWVDENAQDLQLARPGGETTVSVYANKYLTEFSNFKEFNWTGLATVDLPMLRNLDLSGLQGFTADNLFSGGVYTADGVGLKNIETLNLSGLKLAEGTTAYTLDVSRCSKLKSINISNSDLTNIKYPDTLKTLDLSNTGIISLELSDLAFLENIDITGCDKLESIKLSNLGMISSLTIPASIKTVDISQCPLLKTLSITYSSSSSISNLASVSIDSCDGLETVDLTGLNNTALVINLVGAKNLKNLYISSTKYASLTLPNLYTVNEEGERVKYFKSLERLNISNTDISSLTFNDSAESFLDLRNFEDLSYINAHNCQKLLHVKCAYNPENPIELVSGSFMSCSALLTLEGYFIVEGSQVFKGCGQLKLNLETFKLIISPSVYNLSSLFEGCVGISTEIFGDFMQEIYATPGISNIEKLWYGCSGFDVKIDSFNIFACIPNVIVASYAFANSGVGGNLLTEKLKQAKNLQKIDYMFSGSKILSIEQDVFYEGNNFVNVDEVFANCSSLTAKLKSGDFFVNLVNISGFPSGVFRGCSKITLEVENVGDTTLLFHKKVKNQDVELTAEFLDGLILLGEIKKNIFGSLNQEITYNGETFYIPSFASISYPFSNSGLLVNLGEMGLIFTGLSSINQLQGIFQGLTLINNKSIPTGLFSGLSRLNSVAYIFADLDLECPEFPPVGLFDDCKNLKNILGIISGCNKSKIKLRGEGFASCPLENVSSAFKNSAIYSGIPLNLFKTQNSARTIKSMSECFSGCYGLGYDSSFEMLTGAYENLTLSWNNKVVKNLGNHWVYENKIIEDEYSYDGSDLKNENNAKQARAKLYIFETTLEDTISQNYAMPSDLFRYCSDECDVNVVLRDLFWSPNELSLNESTGKYSIVTTTKTYGLKGRLPINLLKPLSNIKSLSGMFKGTNFDPFISRPSQYERGVMFPSDLLEYNTSLENASSMFEEFTFPDYVDMPNIFDKCAKLNNISALFKNCTFSTLGYNSENVKADTSLINFLIFLYNTLISDASLLFCVDSSVLTITGPYIMSQDLFTTANKYISNISMMFYNAKNMSGTVPTFPAAFSYIEKYTSYLLGVNKSNIFNASNVNTKYIPEDWTN